MNRSASHNSGFSLIEMAVVLLIVGLLIGGAVGSLGALQQRQRYSGTEAQLEEIRDALAGPVPPADLDGLRRGDLVFWNGHVGIMTDDKTLLHANGHHMMVVAEPLKAAVDRIAARYGQLTSIRRF